jgi:excisionase family DNA binding protein
MSNAFALSDMHESRSSNRTPLLKNRLTCTVREACSATGIGKTKMHELIHGGSVESAKVGRRRLINVLSLLRLVGKI